MAIRSIYMKPDLIINEIRAKAGAARADDAEERFVEAVQNEEDRLFRMPIGVLDYVTRGIGQAAIADTLLVLFDGILVEMLDGLSDKDALAEERRLLAAQIGDISTELFAGPIHELAVARIVARNAP